MRIRRCYIIANASYIAHTGQKLEGTEIQTVPLMMKLHRKRRMKGGGEGGEGGGNRGKDNGKRFAIVLVMKRMMQYSNVSPMTAIQTGQTGPLPSSFTSSSLSSAISPMRASPFPLLLITSHT